MLWTREITNMTDLIEEWLASSGHIAMLVTSRSAWRELVARGAGRGGVAGLRGAGRGRLVPTPRDDQAVRLMRITGKCVFDDIFRGRRKRWNIRNSKRDQNIVDGVTYYRSMRSFRGRADERRWNRAWRSIPDIKMYKKALLHATWLRRSGKVWSGKLSWKNLCRKRFNFKAICTVLRATFMKVFRSIYLTKYCNQI